MSTPYPLKSVTAPEDEFNARLALFDALKSAARDITLPLFTDGMQVQNKASGSDFDPVTNADVEGERRLRALITNTLADDSIEGEELPDITGCNDWLWTLDPIDGTRAFVAGVPVWSTLVALSYRGVPVIGMIDHPAMGQCFMGITHADQSEAWRLDDNGTKTVLSTRGRDALSNCTLGCTEPLAMLGPGELAAYNIIRRGCAFSRLGLDAFGYGLVASGRMDIIIEALLKPCDVRALMPVVHGAGGRITNWHGGSPVNGGRVVCVGDAGLLPELYTYLGRAMTP
ncbi:inositol monophosphatase family protein [Fretibacter rubidus]|uniref:inositol monophosphatase family protein n=1 Tax=Fretibacter rubidus TaxID=570162 RepID=UPI00352A859A